VFAEKKSQSRLLQWVGQGAVFSSEPIDQRLA
jgi:hypothetical protein